MSSGYRSYGGVILLGSFLASLFAACATGTTLESTGTAGGGGDDAGTSTLPPGKIGGPCSDDVPCTEGSCTKVGVGKYCTTPCPPGCPDGTYCAILDGEALCVPDLGSQCLPCTTVLQCLNPSDECLTAPRGDKFCARDCTTDGECPNGFTCKDIAEYPPKVGGGGEPDAGPGDDGGVDVGDDGGSDAGDDGGVDAGGPPPKPSKPYKFCVPNGIFSCPCTSKRDGVTRTCSYENQYGKCSGTETCDGAGSAWDGCTAKVAAAEACNGDDDDCDGTTDEGEPNDLCKGEGPIPPHASWACSAAGQCGLGACDPGWTNFPMGPVKDGCSCPIEASEPNDTCATPTVVGGVSDTDGSSLAITGTLSSQNDVDVWTFDTVDTPEANTNSYHVSIDFAGPMPNDEFRFDVIRGATCTDTPSGGVVGLTSYDWCVDGKSADGSAGEAPCANDGTLPVHCNDNSSKYFVRVYRKLGATSTCSAYSLLVTAKGGEACDFTKQCQ